VRRVWRKQIRCDREALVADIEGPNPRGRRDNASADSDFSSIGAAKSARGSPFMKRELG
jgi:hypothetical protein